MHNATEGAVLCFEDVVRDLHEASHVDANELRAVFLNKEHPHLLLPWIGTHLCETGAVASMMAEDPTPACLHRLNPRLRYMLAWWSNLGRLIAPLHVPLHMWVRALSTSHPNEPEATPD